MNTIKIEKLSRGFTIFIDKKNEYGKNIKTWTVSGFKSMKLAMAYLEENRTHLENM